jgi:hypothetical protein
MLKYLRFAWSVGCGIVCLLLIAMWVRSYYFHDYGEFDYASRAIILDSARGETAIGTYPLPVRFPTNWRSWVTDEMDWLPGTGFVRPATVLGFALITIERHTWLFMPYWFHTMLFVAFGAGPWIRRQFSLRTLLIATTLVAVVLGIIVAAT